MKNTRIGYARCWTGKQDLAAQRAALADPDVAADRNYADHGLTSSNRQRSGLDQALASVRTGDTLVVNKVDRLARSVPDARKTVLQGRFVVESSRSYVFGKKPKYVVMKG